MEGSKRTTLYILVSLKLLFFLDIYNVQMFNFFFFMCLSKFFDSATELNFGYKGSGFHAHKNQSYY